MAGNSALIFALHLCYNDLQSQHVKHERALFSIQMFHNVISSLAVSFCCSQTLLTCETAQCSFKECNLQKDFVVDCPSLSLLFLLSLSSALCPSKCCCVSHTTRSGRLMNQSVVGGGLLPHRNAKGGQYIRLSCHEPRQESTHCL